MAATLMEILGYDSHIVARTDIRSALGAFAGRFLDRWPSMLVSIESATDPNETWRPLEYVGLFDRFYGSVYFARDIEMVHHFGENSFTPMEDGEGVVAVLYSPVHVDGGTILVPPDEHAIPRRPGYEAALISESEFLAVHLTTPESPSHSEFSRWVKEDLVEALRVSSE